MIRFVLARRKGVAFTLAGAMTLAAYAQAGAATLTPIASYVDPAGGVTSVLGINNAGWMTGSVTETSGAVHGFSRDAGGTYTLFDVNSATFGRAIGESNAVVGYAQDAALDIHTGTEFVRAADGTVTTLTNPITHATLHGIAQGMNASGAIAGDFLTGAGSQRDGFILDGASFTDLSIAGENVRARAITDGGTVAGWVSGAGGTEAFILSGGVYQFFNAPGAVNGTYFEDLNNHGLAAGEYMDAGGNGHAFIFNTLTDAFTNIIVPGATNVSAFGLNDHGQVVLTTDIKDGPNNFLYGSVPEPASWALMLAGFAGMGAALRRRRAVALA